MHDAQTTVATDMVNVNAAIESVLSELKSISLLQKSKE